MILTTPLGPAWAAIDPDGAITAFGFGPPNPAARGQNPELARQIEAYFAGELTRFDLPLNPGGTAFQKRVWAELLKIPCGETRTYTELAALAGIPTSPRAAGRANATNPIALIIPCHRIIGVNGSLTGYAYGTEIKRQLLDWEKKHALSVK